MRTTTVIHHHTNTQVVEGSTDYKEMELCSLCTKIQTLIVWVYVFSVFEEVHLVYVFLITEEVHLLSL